MNYEQVYKRGHKSFLTIKLSEEEQEAAMGRIPASSSIPKSERAYQITLAAMRKVEPLTPRYKRLEAMDADLHDDGSIDFTWRVKQDH